VAVTLVCGLSSFYLDVLYRLSVIVLFITDADVFDMELDFCT